jgi:hypothetical protein
MLQCLDPLHTKSLHVFHQTGQYPPRWVHRQAGTIIHDDGARSGAASMASGGEDPQGGDRAVLSRVGGFQGLLQQTVDELTGLFARS